jgi:hypothetical protein
LKIFIIITLVLIVIFFISSCETGYVKRGYNWAWVTNDEHFGSRDHWIQGVDNESFKVCKQNKNFGTDRHSAYFQGRRVNHAKSDGFVPLTNDAYGYAKDKFHAFLDTEVILKADPNTFEVLGFPYSRDKNDVYNGTIPMNLSKSEVAAFRVTNEDKVMGGGKTTTLLSEFLKFSPEYGWIDSLYPDVKWVITDRWGTGEALGKKFKGLKEVK